MEGLLLVIYVFVMILLNHFIIPIIRQIIHTFVIRSLLNDILFFQNLLIYINI